MVCSTLQAPSGSAPLRQTLLYAVLLNVKFLLTNCCAHIVEEYLVVAKQKNKQTRSRFVLNKVLFPRHINTEDFPDPALDPAHLQVKQMRREELEVIKMKNMEGSSLGKGSPESHYFYIPKQEYHRFPFF